MSTNALVQYVVVRRDLSWPAGPLMAQGVHACVAAIWSARSTPTTAAYCDQADAQMHTVVLGADSEEACLKLISALDEKGIVYSAWREQPEDVLTAVAAAPEEVDVIKPLFKKFKLFK